MPPRIENIIGLKSGRLTVIKELPQIICKNSKRKAGYTTKRVVECLCECSNTTTCLLSHIRRKTSPRVSCGCIRKEGVTTKHGYCGTKTYNIWQAMKARCSNPKSQYYYCYGGRGIKVCDKWVNSFEEFLKDMGECPKNYSIERLDISKNYEPSNCKWIPLVDQAHNTSRTKLNWEIVTNIRKEATYKSKKEVAEKYASLCSVDFRHIYKVINNEVWK